MRMTNAAGTKLVGVTVNNIPHQLKERDQWVVWRAQAKDDGKINKIPVNPKDKFNASVNDPNTWSSFDEAVAYYEEFKDDSSIGGIGFVFTANDPFCGIDLDDCLDPKTSKIKSHAREILRDLNSYSEVSPSNTGVKIIIEGKLPDTGRNFGNVEVYDRARFFTITGERLGDFSPRVENRKEEVLSLYRELEKKMSTAKSTVKSGDPGTDTLPVPYPTKKLIQEGAEKGSRSEAMMSVINSLVVAGLSDQDIKDVFENNLIGEKYREKGASREQWLQRQIDKGRKFVSQPPGSKETVISKDDASDTLAFPRDVMTGAAGNFTKLFGAYLETPAEFLFMSYLTCLGAVLSKRLTLKSEIAPQPRLYTLLLGQSADERKSTALSKTVDHFKETVGRFDSCWGVGSAEGLQKRLESADPSLLLVFDEFSQFVNKCTINSSVLLPCVNTLFESNRYESRTKTSKVHLEDAHLSFLAASTTQTYERTWKSAFTDIGFNNRLFLVPATARRRFSIPEKIPTADKERISSQLTKVLEYVGNFRELKISQDGKELYDHWYMGLASSIHSKRLDTYAMRLMSLLAVNDLKSEVDRDTVEKVVRMCDWQLEVRKQYDPIDADNKVARMEESIRRTLGRGPLKEYKLKQRVNANRAGLWCFETALKNLARSGEITRVKNMWDLVHPHL